MRLIYVTGATAGETIHQAETQPGDNEPRQRQPKAFVGRAISHDVLCVQWEAATVEYVGVLAIWLIFADMSVGDLRQDTSHWFPPFSVR